MAVNDVFLASANDLADAGDFIIDGSNSDTGAAEVTELGGTGTCKVFREVDVDGDGTWEITDQIENVGSAPWYSQLNKLVVSQANDVRIRVTNDSGGTADFFAVGIEVND